MGNMCSSQPWITLCLASLRVSLLSLELACLKLYNPPASTSSSVLGLQASDRRFVWLRGCWDLNPDPHACVATLNC